MAYSPIAQWQSTRLLIEWLLVRIQLGEQHHNPGSKALGFLLFYRPVNLFSVPGWGWCQDLVDGLSLSKLPPEHSPIAQWQSTRLLIERLLVRIQLGEQKAQALKPGPYFFPQPGRMLGGVRATALTGASGNYRLRCPRLPWSVPPRPNQN